MWRFFIQSIMGVRNNCFGEASSALLASGREFRELFLSVEPGSSLNLVNGHDRDDAHGNAYGDSLTATESSSAVSYSLSQQLAVGCRHWLYVVPHLSEVRHKCALAACDTVPVDTLFREFACISSILRLFLQSRQKETESRVKIFRLTIKGEILAYLAAADTSL